MKIVFVSPEVSPYSKSGGLADVAGSLPRALGEMGHEVYVVTPMYRGISKNIGYETDFSVPMQGNQQSAIIRKQEFLVAGNLLTVLFVDNAYYFDREGMYCHPDEAERFAFFAKATAELVNRLQPDILHLNDWQTGPIALYTRDQYHNEHTKIVYTIHNMEYNGRFSADCLRPLGLDPARYFQPSSLEFYGDVSYSKAGILYADMVTTVSQTYAREIQTEEYGFGYEGLMKYCYEQGKLRGILNGIDVGKFNPEDDPEIAVNYNVDTCEKKAENKKSLQQELGLPVKEVPMLAIISRVVQHKGFDILIESLKEVLKEDVQFVMLGMGDEHYIRRFQLLQERFPEKISVQPIFDEALAKRIYASSDLFMMPSLFEPCGLSQLISFRYGTIPIARKTGGLNDTVIGYLGDPENGNGFTFWNPREADLEEVTKKALAVYEKKDTWRSLVQRVMRLDYSWTASAQQYVNMYQELIEKS